MAPTLFKWPTRKNWPELFAQPWDLIVIGGGITGAGVLLEAARLNLKAILLEQRDFAWGTSSRSSKLIHGGLRYLSSGKFKLTHESVVERKALLEQAPGLIEQQSFAFANYKNKKPGRWKLALGLAIYDYMTGKAMRHHFCADDFLLRTPHIRRTGLLGGLCYLDAKTDDARLVLRTICEAMDLGACAVNYARVREIMRKNGRACGVFIQNEASGKCHQINARYLINATGIWSTSLADSKHHALRLRPLRGSHLIFPRWRLPLAQAVSLMHPDDGRPVFAYPWEGVSIVGTTDIDHTENLDQEPSITQGEHDYLMRALAIQFPELGLKPSDILSSYAGVRPIVSNGTNNPSKEGREHHLWEEPGMLNIAGGKLTTFRRIAQEALKKAAPHLGTSIQINNTSPIFQPYPSPPHHTNLSPGQILRLSGRYGRQLPHLLATNASGAFEQIPGTVSLWAELIWSAQSEAVVHLDDLLLRRTRIGIQLAQGGKALMPKIRVLCQAALGWTDAQWIDEESRYLNLWKTHYSPGPFAI